MATQKFVRNKPSIGKCLFVGAIGTWSVHVILFIFDFLIFHFDIIDDFRYVNTYMHIALIILYLLLACGAAYFYLMRAQPQVAARVWGILGVLTLTLKPLILFLILPAAIILLKPVGIISLILFLISMGGILFAVKKPKLAGILMLVIAVLSGLGGKVQLLLAIRLNGFLAPGPADVLFPFVAASFLIPGGILALNRQRKEPVSRKMAFGLIGVFFIAPLLGIFIMTRFLGF